MFVTEAHGMKHAGPVNGVGGDHDVFADDVEVSGPKLLELGKIGVIFFQVSCEGDVVDEGVEPDIGDEVFVEEERNAPSEAFLGTRDAEVGRFRFFDGVEDFGFAEGGSDA